MHNLLHSFTQKEILSTFAFYTEVSFLRISILHKIVFKTNHQLGLVWASVGKWTSSYIACRSKEDNMSRGQCVLKDDIVFELESNSRSLYHGIRHMPRMFITILFTIGKNEIIEIFYKRILKMLFLYNIMSQLKLCKFSFNNRKYL